VDDGRYECVAAEDALNPVWSPRGDLIVYAGKQVSGFSTLQAVRPDGERVALPEIKVWVRDERFRFMPDGSGLVYMSGWFAGHNYWLLDMAMMKPRQLTKLSPGATSRTFDISPDGQTIVFDRRQVKSEIVLIELPADAPGE
jgi:Tol biopolymer transport system component